MNNQEYLAVCSRVVERITQDMSAEMSAYIGKMAECITSADDISVELADISTHGTSGGISGHIYTYEIYERLKPVYLEALQWYDAVIYDQVGEHLDKWFPMPQEERRNYTASQCLIAYLLADSNTDDTDTIPAFEMVIFWFDSAILEYIAAEILQELESDSD